MDDFRVRRDALKRPDDPEYVWWDVIERVYDELRTPYEPDPRLERLTPGQRALYALHWTRSEVENGGFHQYLYNSTGMLADEALLGAELLGATEFAALFREVIALFPEARLPAMQTERIAFLEQLSEDELVRLEELDEQFYALMAGDPSQLALRCETYVRAHPEEFFLPQEQLQPPS